MDNRKVLLLAVLILLLVLVALNFSAFTGRFYDGKNLPTIEVSESIECRRYDNLKVANVFVDAGIIGLDRKYTLYRIDEAGNKRRIGGATDNLCGESICKGKHSRNYRLNCDINSGEYFFRFTRNNYDLDFDSPHFMIKHTG